MTQPHETSWRDAPRDNGSGQNSGHFLHRLESLRGVAALFVAIHHALWVVDTTGTQGRIIRALEGVFYGRGAVICFFILSGLVLGGSLRRIDGSRGSGYLNFGLRRLLRIYPAFLVSICACAALLHYFSFWKTSGLPASAWYESFYLAPTSWSGFWRNVFFLEYDLNPVCWSLSVELSGSFLLPLLHLASRTTALRLFLMVGLFTLHFFEWPVGPFAVVMPYLWMFYLGYLIPLLPAQVWGFVTRYPLFKWLTLTLAVAVCLVTLHAGHHHLPYALAMSFIVSLIFGLPHDSAFSFLDRPILKFYGRISYSFYLFHWPIVYALAGLTLHALPSEMVGHWRLPYVLGLAVLSIGLATPIADLCYQFVERPFIALGKSVRRGRSLP